MDNRIETTLCLLMKDNNILLAMKKKGFGTGKYNGVGGKIEKNETPEEAMIRETQEEINVTPTRYEKVGLIEFDEYYKGDKAKLAFHLYIVHEWIGNPSESDEMNPEWFDISNIPYDKMFQDDKYWLPLILEGKKIKAYFEFDENWNLLSKKINELEEMLEIKTARLRIIETTEDELKELIKKYKSLVPELSTAYQEMLDNCIQNRNEYAWFIPWKICLLEDGQEVGYAGFKGYNNGYPEIGYGIDDEYQENGYATEAVKALCDWAIKMPGVVAIEAETESSNIKSSKVLIKNGFIESGNMGVEGPRYILRK